MPREAAELRRCPLRAGARRLWLVVLDSSGSTVRGQGLAAAKGAVASLIETAYLERARVGILQFAGQEARLAVAPRRAPRRGLAFMQGIAGGGGTPLRRALQEVIRVLERERRRCPGEEQTLVLFTDGRSRDRVEDLGVPCRTLVVDTETGPVRLGRCRELARALKGDYLALESLPVRRREDR